MQHALIKRCSIDLVTPHCFAGVPMGTLFGQKIARRILGEAGGESVFDTEPPTKFWYRGNAWFVPHALKWMSRNDR